MVKIYLFSTLVGYLPANIAIFKNRSLQMCKTEVAHVFDFKGVRPTQYASFAKDKNWLFFKRKITALFENLIITWEVPPLSPESVSFFITSERCWKLTSFRL